MSKRSPASCTWTGTSILFHGLAALKTIRSLEHAKNMYPLQFPISFTSMLDEYNCMQRRQQPFSVALRAPLPADPHQYSLHVEANKSTRMEYRKTLRRTHVSSHDETFTLPCAPATDVYSICKHHEDSPTRKCLSFRTSTLQGSQSRAQTQHHATYTKRATLSWHPLSSHRTV
jgi:hypothetical protein